MSVTPPGARRAFALLVALACLLIVTVPVLAHAELQATFPKAGASVDMPPRNIAARFSEAITADSSIELRGPDGASLAKGGIDPDDDHRLLLTAPSNLGPGEYEVRWQAFADDGHLERGTFTFTVVAPTPAPSSAAPASRTPASSADPSDVPLPSPSADPDPASGAGAGGDIVIPIVAALVVLGGLGLFLLRGRGGRRA